jgi:hypothetical protein
MSKGIFLVGRLCCRTARVRVWCQDADEATVTDDLHAVLTAQGVTHPRVQPSPDPAATLLTARFHVRDVDLIAVAAALTARGYEAF